MTQKSPELLCPSAPASLDGAVVFGVQTPGEAGAEVVYLEEVVPYGPEVGALTAPLRPTEVLRIAAPCQKDGCSHWGGDACSLVERIVGLVPVASLTLPACRIRPSCRWFAEKGREACRRCSSIVTQDEAPTDEVRAAAEPPR